jgi:RNA polymerase sigma-70 factor (ECF subfamily)
MSDAPFDTNSTDRELVEQAREGDEAAFKILVERYLQNVYTFCLRYTGSPADAEDAAQETFVKAWRNLNRFNTSKALKTWLFAIAKNSATDLLRKRRAVHFSQFDTSDDGNVLTDTLADTEPLPEELFSRKSLANEVRASLEQLKPRDRTLLSLRYEEELSFEEIARLLKMSPNTVRSLHRRALILLRKQFQKEVDNP